MRIIRSIVILVSIITILTFFEVAVLEILDVKNEFLENLMTASIAIISFVITDIIDSHYKKNK